MRKCILYAAYTSSVCSMVLKIMKDKEVNAPDVFCYDIFSHITFNNEP